MLKKRKKRITSQLGMIFFAFKFLFLSLATATKGRTLGISISSRTALESGNYWNVKFRYSQNLTPRSSNSKKVVLRPLPAPLHPSPHLLVDCKGFIATGEILFDIQGFGMFPWTNACIWIRNQLPYLGFQKYEGGLHPKERMQTLWNLTL